MVSAGSRAIALSGAPRTALVLKQQKAAGITAPPAVLARADGVTGSCVRAWLVQMLAAARYEARLCPSLALEREMSSTISSTCTKEGRREVKPSALAARKLIAHWNSLAAARADRLWLQPRL